MELLTKGLSQLTENFTAPARFIMSISDDVLLGNINPITSEGKLEVEKKIEDLFRRANAEKETILLSKSGEIKDNLEYFESVLREMKKEYPEVIIDDIFSLAIDPTDETKSPETRAMSMMMSFKFTSSTFILIDEKDMISGDLELANEEEKLVIRFQIEKIFEKGNKVKVSQPTTSPESFKSLLEEMKEKYPKVEVVNLFGVSPGISLIRPPRPVQLSYAQRKRLKNSTVESI